MEHRNRISTLISVQQEDFDPGAEYQQLENSKSVGAITTFTGTVRNLNLGEQVGGLFLEHYPGITASDSCTLVIELFLSVSPAPIVKRPLLPANLLWIM